MTERPAPDEVIEHDQVTLRRYREDDLDAVFQAVTESLDHLRRRSTFARGRGTASVWSGG